MHRSITELKDRKTAVVLCGEDQIVHAKEVRRYLTGEDEVKPVWSKDGLQVLFFPELDHAVLFDSPKHRKILTRVVRDYSIRGEQPKILRKLD
jgi:hypothetical protein